MNSKEEKLLKIGELAKLSGVSVKALHVYEKKDIIKPVKIDENTGYRSAFRAILRHNHCKFRVLGVTINRHKEFCLQLTCRALRKSENRREQRNQD